jgi:hypothetical protein
MVLEQGPLAGSLLAQTKQFLAALQERRFDDIWNNMMTVDAKDLLSHTLQPLQLLREGRIEQLLEIDLICGLALAFQMDHEGMRTGFFTGVASRLESIGWYAMNLDDRLAFATEDSAVLIVGTGMKPVIVPFVRQQQGTYVVDWEAFAAFSMFVSSQSLFEIATRAKVYGELRTARIFFDYSARLSEAYDRLRRLVWDHAVVGQFITSTRKQELEAEVVHAERAKTELQVNQEDQPRPETAIDMTSFLQQNFAGYDQILEHLPSEEEIAQLLRLDDAQLRSMVSRLLTKADPVKARQEARKAHGPAELADIVVNVVFDNQAFTLCLPFKSGLEGGSAKSVPESVVYQVWRPHMFLDRAVVVFITAKPCSAFLEQDIWQSRNRMGWAIEVIQHEALAGLLKANGLLGSTSPSAATGSKSRRLKPRSSQRPARRRRRKRS